MRSWLRDKYSVQQTVRSKIPRKKIQYNAWRGKGKERGWTEQRDVYIQPRRRKQNASVGKAKGVAFENDVTLV